MNIKQIIIFILLTTILVILAYTLLDIVDKHGSYIVTIILTCLIIANITIMTGQFMKVMKSTNHKRKI